MTKTSCSVKFGLYDAEIRNDGTITGTHVDSRTKLSDLRTGNVTKRPLASFEESFWLLDGNYMLMPADTSSVHFGFIGSVISNAVTGVFGTANSVVITFTTAHTSDALTLIFSPATGDWVNSVKVAYYTTGNVLIKETTYAPDSAEYTIPSGCEGFGKIILTCYSTNKPGRRLRLQGINYGQLLTFDGSDIRSASLIEEVDPISAEVRGNALDLKLYSSDADFNLLNPSGYFANLAQYQPIDVYETVDGTEIFMGQYYLDTWENASTTEIDFHCVDLIALTEKVSCRGGLWSGAGIAVETLLASIMSAASIPYELDTTLNGTAIIGWLPYGPLRDALQQIAFAIGASVDCSRSGVIRISASKFATDTTEVVITSAQKGAEQALKQRPIIARVDLTVHGFINSTESRDLFDGTLAAGTYEISFSDPMHTLSETGATIDESGANYAIITVAAPGTVTLSGLLVRDTKYLYSLINSASLSAINSPLEITGATLVHGANAADVAARVLTYHEQRYTQEFKVFANLCAPGNVAEIDTLYGRQIKGVIEHISTDLTGGMVSQVQVIGAAV